MYTYIYINTRIYMCIYTYVYIYIHTNIHTIQWKYVDMATLIITHALKPTELWPVLHHRHFHQTLHLQ